MFSIYCSQFKTTIGILLSFYFKVFVFIPLQDVTQDQFRNGVEQFAFKVFTLDWCLTQANEFSLFYYLPITNQENGGVHAFLKDIYTKHKRLCPGFELRLPIPLSVSMRVWLSTATRSQGTARFNSY